MKKFVVMAALAFAAVAAQAVGSYTVNNLAEGYNGYKIMYIEAASLSRNYDAAAKEDMNTFFLDQEMWEELGVKSWKEYYEALPEYLEETPGTVKNGSATMVDSLRINPGANYSAVFALFEDGLTPGSKYDLFETVYYNGASTLNPTFDMTNAKVIQSGTLMADAIPEPTSALLMLIGLAASP